MSPPELAVVAAVALLGIRAALCVRERERAGDIPKGDLRGFAVAEVALFLMTQYRKGLLHPRGLEAARKLPRPWLDPFSQTLNVFVCLDVASGRYREALEWRSRWAVELSGESDVLVKINEAEALACLGRLEESLALVDSMAPQAKWLRTARAAHRAWALAELGRVDDARGQLAELETPELFPPEYVAELCFSKFAVAWAGRDLEASRFALDEAQRFVVRESSRRNLHFYRARLAVAEGELDQAIEHFTRGGQSVYRAQGGSSLVEWGATLMQLGREQEAREKWQRCLVEDPQSPAAAVARELLGEPAALSAS